MRKLLIAALATLASIARRERAVLSGASGHRDRAGERRRTDRHDRPHRDGARAAAARAEHHHRERRRRVRHIGTGRLVRADPDGYTIGIGGPNHYVVNQSVYPLTYDPLKDFEPISLLANGPMIIMSRNSLPAKNLSELIAWLKAKGTTSRSEPAGSQARRISAASRCRP